MKNSYILLLGLMLLFLVPLASAATIEVGPGQPYTDIASGVAAANPGDSVHVNAGTYPITNSISVTKSIKIYGDGYQNTIITVASKNTAGDSSHRGYFYVTNTNNVEISDIKIIGPAASLSDQWSTGGPTDYCNGVVILGSSNVNIHDMYFTLLISDGVRILSSNHITVQNCQMIRSGHDGVEVLSGSSYVYVKNCIVDLMVNCGIRIDSASNVLIQQCTLEQTSDYTGTGSGGVEYEQEGSTTPVNTTVDHCILYNLATTHTHVGIFNYNIPSVTSSTATISNDIFYNCGTDLSNMGSATVTNKQDPGSDALSTWISSGYGFDISGSHGGVNIDENGGGGSKVVYGGSPLPTIVYPANNAVIHSILGNVTFQWSNVNSTNYSAIVADNSAGTNPLYWSASKSPSISLAIPNGTYWWNVGAYDDVHHVWVGTGHAGWQFTVNGIDSSLPVGAYGVIYDTDTSHPITGAVVTLKNDTWSQAVVTGADGTYSINVPRNSGLYYLNAGATGYQTTDYMPLNMTSSYYEKDLPLIAAPSYFQPHEVTFLVRDNGFSNTKIVGADVSVYKRGNDPTNGVPDMEGVTTSLDGAIVFSMKEDINYTIITTYGNVTDIETTFPAESQYKIYLNTGNLGIPQQYINSISINVTASPLNGNSGIITAIYTDNMSTTNDMYFLLGQKDFNGTFIPLGLAGSQDNWSAAQFVNGQATDTWNVTNAMDQSYVVRVYTNSSIFGQVTEDRGVGFPGNSLPFMDNLAIGIIMVIFCVIIGSAFGAIEKRLAPIVTTIVVFLALEVGAFNSFNNYVSGATTILGVMIAALFVYSGIYYMQNKTM